MFSNWSIRAQMSVLVLSATVPLVGVVAYNFINASDAALTAAEHEVGHQAADVANGFTATLRANERSLASLAGRDEIRDPAGPDCRALTRAHDIAFSEFNWLAYFDTGGALVCGTWQTWDRGRESGRVGDPRKGYFLSKLEKRNPLTWTYPGTF